MSDLGSQVLDTVLALAFVFFLLALICSALREAGAALFRTRAGYLEKGLRQLLTDETANRVLDHPLVSTTAPGRHRTPSYLSARTFSLTLLDTLAPPPEDRSASHDVLEAVRQRTTTLPETVARQLVPLLEDARGDLDRFRSAVETWFDEAMERVSGWYKRRTQLVLAVLAVAVTIGFNVSTLRVVDRLWNDPLVRDSVASVAVQETQDQSAAGSFDAKSESGAAAEQQNRSADEQASPVADAKQAGEEAKDAADELVVLNLPIGWGDANDEWDSWLTLVGWAVTAVAVWLGAPFWFQALSRLAPLRSAGPRPSESGSNRAV